MSEHVPILNDSSRISNGPTSEIPAKVYLAEEVLLKEKS